MLLHLGDEEKAPSWAERCTREQRAMATAKKTAKSSEKPVEEVKFKWDLLILKLS